MIRYRRRSSVGEDFNHNIIDLIKTQVNNPSMNPNILIPPPIQFSDFSIKNGNDNEIESGIESDSNSDAMDKNMANKEKRFVSTLFININNDTLNNKSNQREPVIIAGNNSNQTYQYKDIDFLRNRMLRSSSMSAFSALKSKGKSLELSLLPNHFQSKINAEYEDRNVQKEIVVESKPVTCRRSSFSIVREPSFNVQDTHELNSEMYGFIIGKIQNESHSRFNEEMNFDIKLDKNNLKNDMKQLLHNNTLIENGIKLSKSKTAQSDIDSKFNTNHEISNASITLSKSNNDSLTPKLKSKIAKFELLGRLNATNNNFKNETNLKSTVQINSNTFKYNTISSFEQLNNFNKARKTSLDYDGSMELPQKGALKKPGTLREPSLQRSPLKVRWKDMMDIQKKTAIEYASTHNYVNQKNYENDIQTFLFEISKIIDRLKRTLDLNTQTFSTDLYDSINNEIDILFNGLNISIENLRVISCNIPDRILLEIQNDLSQLNISLKCDIESKKIVVADLCKNFINETKNLVCSTLTNDTNIHLSVLNSVLGLSYFIRYIFELSFMYLYKFYKLDEMRQILVQLLNLLNNFRQTLNVSYLSIIKQIDGNNMNLLVKQSTSLANEIGLIITLFKTLF